MSAENQCPTCGKKKQLYTAGSFTQWLNTCSCETEGESLEQFVCASCGKPLKSKPGQMTDWVMESCQCDIPVYLRISDLQARTITNCSLCNKPIASSPASMTQWIFGDSRCKCKQPQPVERSLQTYYQPGFDYADGQDDESEIELDEKDFPKERYIPIKELGRGAAGYVYLSRDRLLNKRVAVKTLIDLSPEQLISFQTEAKATARLDHPGIVDILDFGVSEHGTPYMVMDYFSGVSLETHLLVNGVLSEEKAKSVLLQLASALSYAHEHGVFHRDLKPGNILVKPEAEGLKVCLLDFGVAKVKEISGFVTSYQDKTLVGTPSYMSPDQANGFDFDARSEIYSLGCVMFEALTGSPPFLGNTALETLSMHASSELPPVEEVLPAVGRQFAEVIYKCLAKERESRFASMAELVKDLSVKQESEAVYDTKEKSTGLGSARHLIWLSPLLIVAFLFYAYMEFQQLNKPKKVEAVNPKVTLHKTYVEQVEYLKPSIQGVPGNEMTDEYLVLTKPLLSKIMHPILLDLSGMKINGSGLKSLKSLRLDSLNLSDTELTDENCKILKLWPLRTLFLNHTKITGVGLKTISGIGSLGFVDLTGCKSITESDFQCLENLKRLKMFWGRETNISDKALFNLSKVKTLNVLELSYTDVAFNGKMEPLLNLMALFVVGCKNFDAQSLDKLSYIAPGLHELRIGQTNIKSGELQALTKFEYLGILSVTGLPIEDRDLAVMAKLKNLRILFIDSNLINDQSLEKLHACKNLQEIIISKAENITDAGIKKLKAYKPALRITRYNNSGKQLESDFQVIEDMYK